MGAIGGILGINGGAGGTGFAGPAQADQTGMNNLEDAYKRFLQVSNGQGPNPAQAQYFQNTQDLAKQQAGALGSVQGISPALATRLISQQGSGAMQNAAAAGATNAAQQQLGALSAAGNIAGSQATAANQSQANINTTNASLAGAEMGNTGKAIGGAFGGAGLASVAAAHGGVIPPPSAGPQSYFGKFFCGGGVGERLKAGGSVPGKASVPGDSLKNDTVAAKLSPGEVVLPRSVVNSKDPGAAAAKFVEAVLAKKGGKK